MAGSSDIQIAFNIIPTPVTKEFTFPALYLHHYYAGTNPNQLEIVAGRAGFGTTLVNSWEIYNGDGPEAQLVGHAQGLHISAKNWHNSFTIVFESERLKESTLTVMGQSVVKEGEWAIVGGTGVFSMANGVIKRTLHRQTADGDILELTIHGFTTILPIVTKSELWGGKGKTQHDIRSTPLRLQSVTVRTSDRLNGLYFTYTDQSGKTQKEGLWGGGGGGPYDHLLKLDPSEYVMEVSGTIINNYVESVTIVTNKQKFGPYGAKKTNGSTFATTVPRGNVIVGFYATATGPMINSLGVYSVAQYAASP